MKFYLGFVVSIFLILGINAQKIQWKTIEEAEELIKENSDKKIFIDFYATWCGPCKLLDKKTFKDKKVAAYINANFIPVKFNAEIKKEVDFFEVTYKNTSGIHDLFVKLSRNNLIYPTMVIVDKFGHTTNVINGYYNKKKMLLELKKLQK